MPESSREQVSLYLSEDEERALKCRPRSAKPHGWIIGLARQFVLRNRPLGAIAARSSPGSIRRTVSLPPSLAADLTRLAKGAGHADILRTLVLQAAGIAYAPQEVQEEEDQGDLIIPVAVPRTLTDSQVLPVVEADLTKRQHPLVRVVPIRVPASLRARFDAVRGDQAPAVYISTVLGRAAERRRVATSPPVEFIAGDPRTWRRRMAEFQATEWPSYRVSLQRDVRADREDVVSHLAALCGVPDGRLMLIWDSILPPEDDGIHHLCRVVITEATILDLRCTVEVCVLEHRHAVTVLVEIVCR